VVQDAAYQTDYLQDYIRRNKLARPTSRGRIWRLAHEGARRDRRPALSKETAAGLVGYLSHPNGWWRDTAQQLLVQRGDPAVVPALRELARSAPDGRTKLHALGTLAGLESLDVATLQPLLADPSPDVRAWAVRWSEPWLAEPGHPLAAAVLRLADDPHWTVRRQVAASIGELPPPARGEPALAMLTRYGGDPVTVDAVVSGLAGMEEAVLTRLLQGLGRLDTADAVTMLSGAVARSRTPAAVSRLLAQASAGGRPQWQRIALLRGLEAGLGGGERTEGGPRAPSPPPPLRLASAPASLTRMSRETGETSALAKAVASHLDWPGKPAARAEVPPLTADEKARFEAGHTLYGTTCLACHGPDGRGRERQAPPLVGSPLLVGDVGVPARIVLGGKEGEMGLMPPLTALSDAEVAAVLTYTRRAWGNAASAVAPEAVAEIRGLTKVRTRPWTADELRALPR
jgi:mono/diheme cytochrome c family protein